MGKMSINCAIAFALLIASICIGEALGVDSSACGDWVSFQDEWCYKILDDTFRTFDEAVASCGKLESTPTLPIIRTKAEQEFLSNYLFKVSGKVESFWIGARNSKNNNKFHWIDNTELSFTNWDAKGVHNKENYCVQIQGDENLIGKWIDEPCDKKKNLVVCQKMQTWTLVRLQKALLDTRKELKDSREEATHLASKKELSDSMANAQNHIKSLEQRLASVKSELETANNRIQTQEQNAKTLTSSLEDSKNHIHKLEKNPVPVGFIYVQFPNQLEPKSIWPTVGWSQITSSYAGQFFRAEGGASAIFGTIQEGDCPRLTNVGVAWHPESITNSITLTPGQWSPFVTSGGPGTGLDHNALRFLNSNVEVRPRNQAVRLWKRST